MSTVVKHHMKKAFALLMSFAVSCGLLCIPGFGRASVAQADEPSQTENGIYVSGVDFMQTQAQGWDVLKVDNIGDKAIYITVEKDGTPLSNPVKFTAANNSDVNKDYTDDGAKIAQIVAVQMTANANSTEGQTAHDLLGVATNHPTYTISASDALMQGADLFTGTIYPVYGKIVDSDGSFNYELLGIRTVRAGDEGQLKNIGVGNTYYWQNTATDSYATPYSLQMQGSIDNYYDSELKAYIVTYKQDAEADIQGSVNYVDTTTGEVVMTETFTGIGDTPQSVGVKMSIIVQDPNDENSVKYYRTVSQLSGTQVELSKKNASYTVNVIEVKNMDGSCYPVIVKYVDEKDNLLWSDTVYVKGNGYRYTLPNTFSMNTYGQLTSPDGVNFYSLDKVIGGEVVNVADTDESIKAQEASANNVTTASVSAASKGNGTAVNLTRQMDDANFVIDENGQRVVKAVYNSQDVTKEVTFTLIEINGETNEEIGRVNETVTPDKSFSYAVEDKVIGGITYVPWAGNPEKIEYTWQSLGQGVDLVQYVYYVPEGYVPGDGYEITIQYKNIDDNGAILRTQTLFVDPEMTDYLVIVSDERFTQDGNEYVLVNGEEARIPHAYYNPNRTYTFLYREVTEPPAQPEAPAEQPTTPSASGFQTTPTPDRSSTSGSASGRPTPVAGAVAENGDPLAEAGIIPGDGTVIINDDDNPLINLDGQDVSTERVIEENENPLAFAPNGPGGAAIAGIVAGALVVIGVVAFLLIRRRKNDQEYYSI